MGQVGRNLLPSPVQVVCCTIHTSLKSLKIVLDGDPSIYETIVGVILISRILVLYDSPAETTVRRKLKAEFSPILPAQPSTRCKACSYIHRIALD